MYRIRQQSTTTYPVLIYLVLSSDHVTPATGKTVTVTISKNGGSFGAAAGAVTEIGNGWYALAGNATDRNTLGATAVRATATGCDEFATAYTIVPFDPFDAVRLGLTALPNAAAAAAGGIPTFGTGSGQVNPSGGKVPATLASTDVTGNVAADLQTVKTQAVTCPAPITVGVFVGNGTAALAVDASGRVDLGKWIGSAPNALQTGRVDAYAGQLASGVVTASSVAATALNGKGDWNTTTPPTAAANADAVQARFAGPTDSVQAGPSPTTTAFAGSSGLSSTDNFYLRSVLVFTSGTLDGLSRKITGYTGSTRTFAFDQAWPVAPTAGDTFMILGLVY